MIAAALRAEADARAVQRRGRWARHRRVVRNRRARERKVTVGSGTVAIEPPRVNDKRVDEETGGVKSAPCLLNKSGLLRLLGREGCCCLCAQLSEICCLGLCVG